MSEKEPMYFWIVRTRCGDFEVYPADSEAMAFESLKSSVEDEEVGYVLQSVAEVKIVKRSEVVVTK